MKRGIYNFITFLLIVLIAFGNVSANGDDDNSDDSDSDSQAESDAESARQQAESDAESARQQEESDAEAAKQQEESDAESARQQEESDSDDDDTDEEEDDEKDDDSIERPKPELIRERVKDRVLERIEVRKRTEAENRERLRTLIAQKTGKEISIEVELKEGTSEIEVEIDDEEVEFTLDTTDKGSIIKAIQERTGLTPSEIVRTMRVERERDEEVEVKLEKDGRAKIKIKVGDKEEEFRLETTNREEILKIIAERLGTTPERVSQLAQVEFREKRMIRTADGLEEIEIEEERDRGKIKRKIKIRNHIAETLLELEEEIDGEEVKLKAKLSNGNRQDIKIMPDRASDIAIERLKAKDVEIELREVGNRAVFEARNELEGRLFGLFKARLRESVEIDPETGEILNQGKPWWAFLVSGEEEVVEETDVAV